MLRLLFFGGTPYARLSLYDVIASLACGRRVNFVDDDLVTRTFKPLQHINGYCFPEIPVSVQLSSLLGRCGPHLGRQDAIVPARFCPPACPTFVHKLNTERRTT